MKELYTKVTKGTYPEIPKHFSRDLGKMIGLCLNTNPRLRPTAAELLNMPAFGGSGDDVSQETGKKGGHHRRSNSQVAPSERSESKIDLLQTIKLPRNLK